VNIRDKGGLKEVDPKLYTASSVAAPNEEVKEDAQSDENRAKANAQEECKVPEKKSASGQ
jgi:hypothetical protein